MCGLAGIIKKTGAAVERSDLVRMLSVQSHRGPNGSGVSLAHQSRIGFGHVRLAIIDLATGQQPMWSNTGEHLITFNGEIYDHAQHRERLQREGMCFRTQSDTEVILNLYRRHGLDFLHHLNGEFAFALWDQSQRLFVAARDRYGVKPFFYRDANDELLFASEAKGLLALPRVPRALSSEHLVTSLVSASFAAVSPFEGLHILKPGHCLVWKDGAAEAREIEYWRPRYATGSNMPHQEVVASVREVFQRAVRRRMVAEVPVCTFLSGGLDSTLVTAQMAQLMGASALTAFTVGFVNSEFDESAPAADIAREIGVQHDVLPVTMTDITDHIEDCVEHVELHLVNPAAVGKYLLSRHVRDHGFKVALTGEGSDELFAGYPYFKLEALWRMLEHEDPAVRRRAKALFKTFRRLEYRSEGLLWTRTHSWQQAPRPLGFASYPICRTYEYAGIIPRLIDFKRNRIAAGDGPIPRLVAAFEGTEPDAIDPLHASLTMALGQLSGYIIPTLGDRVEMSHSIEGRTPFLDVELAELTFQIPAHELLDVDCLREKKILHEALAGLIPPSAKATRKHPFFSPNWRALSRTPHGRELLETYLSDAAIDRVGVFQKDFLKKVRIAWTWWPQSSVFARKLDVQIGVALTTQIMHERLLRRLPQVRVEVQPEYIAAPPAENVHWA